MLQQSNNKRYRLLNHQKKCYIIDSDTNIFLFFFPWLIWLFPFNAYEIEKMDNLKADNKNGNRNIFALHSSILSIVMIRIIPSEYIVNQPYPNHTLLLSILGTCILLSLFALRLYISKKRAYKGKTYQLVKIKMHFLKYYSLNWKIMLAFFFGFIVSCLFLFELFKQFILGGNPIILIILLLLYLFLLFANQTIQAPIKYHFEIEYMKRK